MHMGGKISACVVMKNSDNAEVAKDMAMQVASMSRAMFPATTCRRTLLKRKEPFRWKS